jgi:hypothetical protein
MSAASALLFEMRCDWMNQNWSVGVRCMHQIPIPNWIQVLCVESNDACNQHFCRASSGPLVHLHSPDLWVRTGGGGGAAPCQSKSICPGKQQSWCSLNSAVEPLYNGSTLRHRRAGVDLSYGFWTHTCHSCRRAPGRTCFKARSFSC